MYYALCTTDYALCLIHTHYAIHIMNYTLRITHYILRITHYALCITHYALPLRSDLQTFRTPRKLPPLGGGFIIKQELIRSIDAAFY